MKHQNNEASKLTKASITVVVLIFCITFLSSCAVWVRTPGDYDHGHGRQGDNGRHRGEHHDGR